MDINSNPDNPIINIRSFGENADVVIKHSFAFMKGTQSRKVMSCVKHFPGHGDTDMDSHIGLPVLNMDLNDLKSRELQPFIYAIESGVKSVMTGHLALPNIDDSGLPASLSTKITREILRDELGYKGIVITDALDMQAISKSWGSAEASVMAVKAGADIALMPEDAMEAIRGLAEELERNDDLRQESIERTRLIIKEKRWTGLSERLQSNYTESSVLFGKHEKAALFAALGAIEIRGNEKLLPLPEEGQFASFAFIQDGLHRDKLFASASEFFKILAHAVENDCDFGYLDETISQEDLEEYKKGTKDAEVFVMAYFYRASAYSGTVAVPDRVKELTKELAGDKPIIAVILGNPYMAGELGEDATILAYSDALPSVAATVLKLSGKTVYTDEDIQAQKN